MPIGSKLEIKVATIGHRLEGETSGSAERIVNRSNLSLDNLFVQLNSSAHGLSQADAAQRLIKNGPNQIEKVSGQSITVRLFKEFTHFFALILWLAAGLAFFAEWQQPGQGMLTLCSEMWLQSKVQPLDDTSRAALLSTHDQMTEQGLRVIALAYRPLNENKTGRALALSSILSRLRERRQTNRCASQTLSKAS